MRWRHVPDHDSQRQAVKSKGFLCIGQRKLTVTVCPRCKAVYRSGVMECHDTMSSHVMECHEEIVTSQVDRHGMVDALGSQEQGVDRQR